MGTIAARKSREILNNSRKVLAMELLAACQAIDLRGKKTLGKGTEVAYNIIRECIPEVEEDRVMYKDINTCEDIIKSNEILNKVQEKIGNLL